jgi:hypothetical protein
VKQFTPGCDYELCPVFNGGDQSVWDTFKENWEGLPVRNHYLYEGAGCDIGSFAFFTSMQEQNVFQVNCVTRVYAHRAGWLNHLVQARYNNGPGLYATSVSREGGHLHACCRCYAFDSDDFKKYPHKIVSRDQGVFFELGEGCLLDWFVAQNLAARVVYWDSVRMIGESDYWRVPNCYRDGNQENILVWDKHSQAYAEADDARKRELEQMCFGVDRTPVTA